MYNAGRLVASVIAIWMFMNSGALAAGIISNGARNIMVDQTASRSASYTLSAETQTEHEKAMNEAIGSAVGTAGTLGASVAGSAAAGAGPLAGYAGLASTVASLPFGSTVTGVIGSALAGHSVAGAAATAVCTTAVGGPVIMGGIVIGTAGAVGYGIYKGATYLKHTSAGKWTTDKAANAWEWLKSKW